MRRASPVAGSAPGRIAVAVLPLAPCWRRPGLKAATLARQAALAAIALSGRAPAQFAELSIALADDATVQSLNKRYRGKDKPANVLSFAATERPQPRPEGAPLALGDVILAGETVAAEAAAQGKPLADHLRHLVVHGVLHLLGYDHEAGAEARRMEALEVRVLAQLGVANPYAAAPAPRRRPARA